MLALAAIAATLVVPQQLYVAPTGKDSWSGTIDRPFATLQRAQEAVRGRTGTMQSDIVVNVRAGTYRLRAPLRISAGESGRNGHRVIYQAFGYGTPAQERVATGAYLELGRAEGGVQVRVNGRRVHPASVPPSRIDVGPFLRRGKNEIEVEVTTTVKNRLVELSTHVPGYQRFRLRPQTQPYGLLGPVRLVPYAERRVTRPS